jgi:hypothetical protein
MDITLYERLAGLNRHLRDAQSVLQDLERAKELRILRAQKTYRLQLEELRASISEQVMEALSEVELRNAGRFWRKRRAIENRWKDSAGGNDAQKVATGARAERGLAKSSSRGL